MELWAKIRLKTCFLALVLLSKYGGAASWYHLSHMKIALLVLASAALHAQPFAEVRGSVVDARGG